MRFAGLELVTFCLALLALGGVVIGLYMLRPPRRRVMVAALSAWTGLASGGVRAGLPRLRGLGSALLALAVVALSLLALADPVQHARPGRSVVLLIDHGASMAAHDVAPSRLAVAQARARSHVRSLAPDDRALVAALGSTVVPLTGFTADATALLAAIDAIPQRDAATDLPRGLGRARDLLAGRSRPALVYFGDGASAATNELTVPFPVHHEQVGTSARNVAITRFAARRVPRDRRHHELAVALANFGPTREPLTLRIHAGSAIVHEEALALAPGEHRVRALADLPIDAPLIEARITLAHGPDALPTDDRAATALPARGPTRVLSVSRENRYLEAALLLDEQLAVMERATPDDLGAAHDVVIFDGVLPHGAPAKPALYLGPPATSGDFPRARRGEVSRPFFDRIVDEHPLVRGLALRDVNIARATAAVLAPEDVAIGATAERTPLLFEGARAGIPFIALTFDPRESDLPLRPAWPLFILRAIDRLAGDEPTLPAFDMPERGGAIAPRRLGVSASAETAPDAARGVRSLRHVLALLAMLILALEWLTFHLRWTE